MSWILNWYESKAQQGSIPDPDNDKGELIKRTIGWFGLFDYDTVELCKNDRVIMEGYCLNLPPVPSSTDPLIEGIGFAAWAFAPVIFRIGSDDGIRLYAGPHKVVDEWNIRTYAERLLTLWLPHCRAPWFKVQYFNTGGNGRVRIGFWWLKKENKSLEYNV